MPVSSGRKGVSMNPPSTPDLLEQVRRRCRVRHYSVRTERAYVAWVWRFIRANGGTHPRTLGGAEVEAFLTGLATEGKVLRPGGVITDGPFVEIRERLGSFMIIKAENIEEALTLAHGCPVLDNDGSVEVRPVFQ